MQYTATTQKIEAAQANIAHNFGDIQRYKEQK